MRDTKYRIETLCLYDYRGVEEHLSAMAAQGWRLEKAGNTLWKYRRAEPSSLRYAVTYHDGASQFNPGPTQGQQSLEELCAAAGWQKVCDWFQAQIFSTDDPTAVPLETDEALRLENIHRSMRKNFLPSSIILLALSLLMSSSFLYSLISGNIFRLFESNAHLFSGTMFLSVAILEIYTLFHYYRWRKNSRRSLADGGSCVPLGPGYRRLNRAMLVLAAILAFLYLLLELYGGGRGRVLFFLLYISLLVLLVFLVRRTTALLRRLKVSKNVNIAGTLIVDVILAFALTGGLAYGIIRSGWFLGDGREETYEYQGQEWDVSPRDDLPLILAELTGEDYAHVRRQVFDQGSFFLPQRTYHEAALSGSSSSVWLDYTIWEPKFPRLQEAVLEEFLKTAGCSGPRYGAAYCYIPESPDPWGADAAYRRHIDGAPLNTWLLSWPGRVIVVSLKEPPSEMQQSLLGVRLGPEV